MQLFLNSLDAYDTDMSDTESFEALQRAESTRKQILNAAMLCIIQLGPARTNISSIASQAGVSRPTVYAYFENLDDLIHEAINEGTQLLCEAIETHAKQFDTQEDRIVAAFTHTLGLAGQVDVLRRPMSFDLPDTNRDVLPDEAINAARQVLSGLMDEMPTDITEANEIAETAVRFFLSLAAHARPTAVTGGIDGYVRRAVLPALGLPRGT